MTQPNILFVMVDCMRADTLWDRQRYPSLPTLDALARSSACFTSCIAAATTTTPSVATMLTGLPLGRHGIRSLLGYTLKPEVRTLAEGLSAAGYYTAAEVTGPLFKETGLNRGFSSYYRRDRHHYLDTAWGHELRRRLREQQYPEPWFLFLHVWELHWPRRAARSFNHPRFGASLYQRSMAYVDHLLGELFAELDLDRTAVLITGDHGEGIAGAIDDPRAIVQAGLKWSYRLTRRLPTETKKRILTLARQVILVGRNPSVPEAQRAERAEVAGHAHLSGYDYLVRVPLVLHAPGVTSPGRLIATQVRHQDIAPTVLDLAGVEPAPGSGGSPSLLPLVRGQETINRPGLTEAMRTMLHDPIDNLISYRAWPYKLIFAPKNPELPVELYDLEADPHEGSNLADLRADLVAQLRQQAMAELRDGVEVAGDQRMTAEEELVIKNRLEQLGYIE